MAHGIRWVGLDVHPHESTIAIFDYGTGELTTKRVVGRPHQLLPWLRGVARPARAVALARKVRALVATGHRHHEIGRRWPWLSPSLEFCSTG